MVVAAARASSSSWGAAANGEGRRTKVMVYGISPTTTTMDAGEDVDAEGNLTRGAVRCQLGETLCSEATGETHDYHHLLRLQWSPVGGARG